MRNKRMELFAAGMVGIRPSRRPGGRRNRNGYTLLEILVATTLSLILMYGVAAIFSRVGSLMSETQNIMGLSGNLRATRDRLELDLHSLTVPRLKAPTSDYGFFSYVEGLGTNFENLGFGIPGVRIPRFSIPDPWVAASNPDDPGNQDYPDQTVGDTDDILSFTARAPEGKWFRGRIIDPDYDNSGLSDADRVASPPPTRIIESEYAEIVWFVRGTTLYRRVLLIVPNDVLQRGLEQLENFLASARTVNGKNYPSVSEGYGFFHWFDVSVHLNSGVTPTKLVANTVADLANRKNRYGYWSSPVEFARDASWTDATAPSVDSGLHGPIDGSANAAWYWLRLPTLQESAVAPDSDLTGDYFRAGVPFGSDDSTANWAGRYQRLTFNNNGVDGAAFPEINQVPCLDFWGDPNFWDQTNIETGDLNFAADNATDILYDDVILTNVLAFDVKAWDEGTGLYVDLGSNDRVESNDPNFSKLALHYKSSDYDRNTNFSPAVPSTPLSNDQLLSANDFKRIGWYKAMGILAQGDDLYHGPLSIPGYSFNTSNADHVVGNVLSYPFMPAIFDTWTADYQKEHFLTKAYNDGTANRTGVSRHPGYRLSDIPTDGTVTFSDLPDYPPPYDIEMKGIKVEIRVFDPVSLAIRSVSLETDFTK